MACLGGMSDMRRNAQAVHFVIFSIAVLLLVLNETDSRFAGLEGSRPDANAVRIVNTCSRRWWDLLNE